MFTQSLCCFIKPTGYNFLGIAQAYDEYMDSKSRSTHNCRTSSVDDNADVTVDDDDDGDDARGKPIHFR